MRDPPNHDPHTCALDDPHLAPLQILRQRHDRHNERYDRHDPFVHVDLLGGVIAVHKGEEA